VARGLRWIDDGEELVGEGWSGHASSIGRVVVWWGRSDGSVENVGVWRTPDTKSGARLNAGAPLG